MNNVDLNQEESEWRKTLGSFKIDLSEDYEQRIEKLETAYLLANSLLSRNAIPEVRLNYFTEPEYNLSNTKSSKEDIFEMNGTKGEEILRHPHFLKYLEYFIYGANLPESLKSQMLSLKESTFYDDDFVEQAAPILKSYFKNHKGKDREDFVEDVFKLSLDLGVDRRCSAQLRNMVLKATYR